MKSCRRGLLIASLIALWQSTEGTIPVSAAPPYVHDPFIVKQGASYYLFSTGQGISVKHSRDLIRWESLPPVFPVMPRWTFEEVQGFTGRTWAPEIINVNGIFYLYYCVSTFGSNRSCIALAENSSLDPASLDFAWIDKGKVLESFPGRDDWNAIDPSPIMDDDGKMYLAFGSFWSGIKLIEIDPLTGKPQSVRLEIVPLAQRPGVPDDPIEAPFILRKGGRYYLFVSFDFCCKGARSDYKIAVGRSDGISGPYVDRDGKPMLEGGGTVILEGSGNVHGPGHGSVLRDGERSLLVHHMYDGSRGGVAVLQVRPITWTDDGWPVAGEALGFH